MDRHQVIAQTMSNMHAIYSDVDRIFGIAEQQLQNQGFEPVGGRGVAWEVSVVLGGSASWMPKYLARCYLKRGTSDRAIGFCVHLGSYDPEDETVFDSLGLRLPLMNATVLKTRGKIPMDRDRRLDLLNALWNAGWHECQEERRIECERLARCRTESYPADSITYFLDLLRLTSKELIKNWLTDPLVKMHGGQENWILENNVPTLPLSPGATHAGR